MTPPRMPPSGPPDRQAPSASGAGTPGAGTPGAGTPGGGTPRGGSPGEDALERALAALPAPAPPPPFGRVLEAALVATARASRRRTRALLAAGVLAVVGGAGTLAWRARSTPDAPADRSTAFAPRARGTAGRIASGSSARIVRRGAVVPGPELEGGDEVEALAATPSTGTASPSALTTVELGDGRIIATLEPGARLVVDTTAGRADQPAGRVTYAVRHDASAPFRLRAGAVEIVDVGTRFTVDVRPDGARAGRVLVTVTEGAVDVGAIRLAGGRGLAFVAGRPTGDAWPLDARPTVSIAAEDAVVDAGAAVVLRVDLENRTDAWLAIPPFDDLATPLVIHASGPAGEVGGAARLWRVVERMLVDGPPADRVIPPKGRVSFRVRFDSAFASPGTYRLRAVYRPADAVDPPASPETNLTVR